MKESYRREQKRRIKELSSALKDPSVIILSSWLKVRKNCRCLLRGLDVSIIIIKLI